MKTPNAKTLFAALAAVATVTAVAAPAAAQPYRDHDRYEQGRWDRDRDGQRGGRGEYNINARQAQLEHRLQQGARRGLITPREMQEMRNDIRSINRLERVYRSDGRLTPRERAELDRRLDWSEARLAGRLDRDYGYGYGHRR